MKWLRRVLFVLLGLPAVVVAVLALAGFRPGAGHNAAEVEIGRPPEEVYRWLSDVERLKSWSGIAEIEGVGPEGFRVGRALRMSTVSAQGRRLAVEGVATTRSVYELAQKHNVDMPLTAAVHAVLFEGRGVEDAIVDLMGRRLRSED